MTNSVKESRRRISALNADVQTVLSSQSQLRNGDDLRSELLSKWSQKRIDVELLKALVESRKARMNKLRESVNSLKTEIVVRERLLHEDGQQLPAKRDDLLKGGTDAIDPKLLHLKLIRNECFELIRTHLSELGFWLFRGLDKVQGSEDHTIPRQLWFINIIINNSLENRSLKRNTETDGFFILPDDHQIIVLEYMTLYLKRLCSYMDIKLPFPVDHTADGISIRVSGDNLLFPQQNTKKLRYLLAFTLFNYNIMYIAWFIGIDTFKLCFYQPAINMYHIHNFLLFNCQAENIKSNDYSFFKRKDKVPERRFNLNLAHTLNDFLTANGMFNWENDKDVVSTTITRSIFVEYSFSFTKPSTTLPAPSETSEDEKEWDLVDKEMPPRPSAAESDLHEFIKYQPKPK
ncbi:hypothetical protein MP638_003466 [Amoeboaphelidium occidentale]|nr:hypothetical protein MP638_003466 [Amoeboaphelidium occidentale]